MNVRRRLDPRTAGALLAAGLPALVACVLAVIWVDSHRLRLFGDEPHYVIIAESITRDADFELRNNYALEARFPQYVGEIDPHVVARGHRWYSIHGPGLGVLIAPGLLAGGVTGARLSVCLLAALLPFSIYVWLNGLLGPRDATWLTLAAMLSIPYVFGAVHLYPDPVAAALAAPLILLFASPAERPARPAAWAAFWLVCGALPLLMVKFLAPALILALIAIARASMLPPASRAAVVRTAPAFLVGPTLLAAYHLSAFGSLMGPRGPGEIAASARQAWMVFLGLHLDQAQGIFLQQPLLLAGVPALGIVAIRRPWLAAGWCVLYASLILPNALQVIPFGGASPSGRFAWPAAWLWLAPLGMALSWHRAALARIFRPALLSAALYQVALAIRWLPAPMSVTNEFTPDLALRNSLFPTAMRAWMPSFYSPDFLSHPPNLVAMAALVALLASGPVLGLRLARRRE